MNNDHMNEPQNQDIHELYQALEQEQPPVALDAQILQAAHQAVAETEQKVVDIRSVRRAWYVPVSYAAIILISLSLVMQLVLEPELQLPEQDAVLPFESMLDDGDESLPVAAEFKAKTGAESHPALSVPATRRTEAMDELGKQQQLERKKEQLELKKKQQERMQTRQVMRAKPMSAPAPAQDLEQLSRPEPEASMLSEQEAPVIEVLNSAMPLISAEDWLLQMQALLSAQQFDELRQSLQAFRQQYPDYELPEELANWEINNLPQDQH